MILACICSVFWIYSKSNCIASFEHTLCHSSNVANLAAFKLDCCINLKFALRSCDITFITFLTTHCCIEYCLINDNCSLISFWKSFYNIFFCCKNCYLGIIRQLVISNEFTCDSWINLIIYSCISTHIVSCLTSLTCFLTLLIHTFNEAVFINSYVLFF